MNFETYAIDTESVGVGPNKESALARVSIVDWQGKKVLDLFCRPNEPVSYIRMSLKKYFISVLALVFK